MTPPPSPLVLFDCAVAAGTTVHTSFEVASATQHSDGTSSVMSSCGKSDGPFEFVVDCSGRHSMLVDSMPHNVAQDKP